MTRRVFLTLAVAAALGAWAAGASAQQHEAAPRGGKSAAQGAHGTESDASGQAGGHGGAGSAAAAQQGGAEHGGGDTHGGGHRTYGLLPDTSDSQTWYSALWVLIIFIVLLAVLYPTAWKNVLAGLKAREERIRKDIAEAEAARVRAEATLKEYNTQLAAAETRVRDMLSKATADGETIAAGIRTRAQQEAEETKDRALRDIEAARGQAVAELQAQAAVLATAVAEKILRRSLNADDQRDLVNQSLGEISAVGAGTGHAGRRVGGRA
jgi:F-type H+-transporting ATPase subunit b